MNKVKNVQLHSFLVVFKLFNKFYWKSIFGPVFAFAFSFILYSILGSVMGYKTMLPAIVSTCAAIQGMTILPVSIMELKNSILLKRIGSSPIKVWVFTCVIILYYLFVILVITFYLMLWAIVFTNGTEILENLFGSFQSTATFFYGVFLNGILSITIGFLIASFSKSSNQAQIIGMIIYFPCAFLSGQLISADLIAKNEVMLWISRFVPFKYTTMLMSESWLAEFPPNNFPISHSFDFKNDFYTLVPLELSDKDAALIKQLEDNPSSTQELITKAIGRIKQQEIKIFTTGDHIAGLFVPILFSGATWFMTIKKFKWTI